MNFQASLKMTKLLYLQFYTHSFREHYTVTYYM